MDSLEDRLLVALSKRGDMSIGDFIELAADDCDSGALPSNLSDEKLVLACEQYAASLPE